MSHTALRLSACLALTCLSQLLTLAVAHGAVTIDASKAAAAPTPLSFATGGRSPDGHVLSVNSRYLTLDGKPWFPVMGEFQYSRYPAADWEREILKMKAGGIRIISTYIFWIHHEEIKGQFDWSGRRDLRHFVELAGRHGMYVWARVGPWDHGEVRNGGLPDWILAKSAVRSNDPAYLRYVERFYGEIGHRLKGLFWKDGGPIVGVQIENEYHERGPLQGEDHILTLRKMAVAAGLEAPFYTVTGWDDAVLPSRDVLPIFGGYPDGFWYRSMMPLPPSPTYFFSSIRRDEDVDDKLCSKRLDIDAKQAGYPFFTAEMAGGMEFSYHRRPVMSLEDIAAAEVVKLGSGVTMYGYYMFHGGTNPEGKKTTLQESQATGYWNDLPLKAYDYQAPLGEFGQMHPSFRELKSFHLFLHDFGAVLAPMTPFFPAQMPQARADVDTPRAAARAGEKSAFIFLNNYQKDHPLPERKDFQVQLKLASETVAVPRQPIKLPAGSYTFWPVNLPLGGATLEYATAQPLCQLDDPGTTLFFAWPGVAPEFAFREADTIAIDAPQAKVERANGRIYVTGLNPGPGAAIHIRARDNRTTDILVLTRAQARNIWKGSLAGRERLILSPADLYFEGDSIHLAADDPAALGFGIYPALNGKVAGFRRNGQEGIFQDYTASVAPANATATVRQLAEARPVGPAKISQEVPAVPAESAFEGAARWSIRVPDVNSAGVAEVLLRISYQGDIARLYAGDKLITDDFYHGTPWEIGLRNIPAGDLEKGLSLEILPLRQDAPIYLSAGARPALFPGGQVAKLAKVQVVIRYRAVAEVAQRNPTLGGFH